MIDFDTMRQQLAEAESKLTHLREERDEARTALAEVTRALNEAREFAVAASKRANTERDRANEAEQERDRFRATVERLEYERDDARTASRLAETTVRRTCNVKRLREALAWIWGGAEQERDSSSATVEWARQRVLVLRDRADWVSEDYRCKGEPEFGNGYRVGMLHACDVLDIALAAPKEEHEEDVL